jgi:hypothetical protein
MLQRVITVCKIHGDYISYTGAFDQCLYYRQHRPRHCRSGGARNECPAHLERQVHGAFVQVVIQIVLALCMSVYRPSYTSHRVRHQTHLHFHDKDHINVGGNDFGAALLASRNRRHVRLAIAEAVCLEFEKFAGELCKTLRVRVLEGHCVVSRCNDSSGPDDLGS